MRWPFREEPKPRPLVKRRPLLTGGGAAGALVLLAALVAGLRWWRGRNALMPMEPMRPHPHEVVVRNRVLLRLDLLAQQAREKGAERIAERLEEIAARHVAERDEQVVAADAGRTLEQLRGDPATPEELRDLLVLPPDLAGAPV